MIFIGKNVSLNNLLPIKQSKIQIFLKTKDSLQIANFFKNRITFIKY